MAPSTHRTVEGSPERLVVGRVVRPWGLKGHLKIESLSDIPSRFHPGGRFFIGSVPYVCQEVVHPPGALVVKLGGVEDREAAAMLRGALLEIPIEEAPPLPEGTYYHYQVLGLEVWTANDVFLGRVTEILETGSNDVYVVQGLGGQVLVPAIAEVVLSVDLEKGRMVIEPIPGLVD